MERRIRMRMPVKVMAMLWMGRLFLKEIQVNHR